MRHRSRLPRSLQAAFAVVLVLSATRVAAQDAAGVPRQPPCDAIRASLHRGSRSPEFSRALGNLRSCPAVGRELLAATWRTPPEDSASLRQLAELTPELGDDRAYDAVEQLAHDQSALPIQRLAALQALASYAAPGTIMAFKNLDRPDLPAQGYVMVGTSSQQGRGIDDSRSDRAHQALRDIVATEPDGLVRTVAAYIVRRLDRKE